MLSSKIIGAKEQNAIAISSRGQSSTRDPARLIDNDPGTETPTQQHVGDKVTQATLCIRKFWTPPPDVIIAEQDVDVAPLFDDTVYILKLVDLV